MGKKKRMKAPFSVEIKGFVSFRALQPEKLLESVASIKSELISVRCKPVIRIPNV